MASLSREQIREILLKVLDSLESTKDTFDTDQIFVSGEFDSNQTKFEEQSNNLEIGVIARSETVGHTLLFFLRMLTDNNFDLARVVLETQFELYDSKCFRDGFESSQWDSDDFSGYCREKCDEFSYTADELIAVYETQETTYGSRTDAREPIRVELRSFDGSTTIEKTADQMDLWTIYRIRKDMIAKDLTRVYFG